MEHRVVHISHALFTTNRQRNTHGEIKKPTRKGRLSLGFQRLATVALAILRGLTGFRSADLAAIGAFARLAFGAAVFVHVTDAASAAMGEDLSCCKQRGRSNSQDDFHIGIIFARLGV